MKTSKIALLLATTALLTLAPVGCDQGKSTTDGAGGASTSGGSGGTAVTLPVDLSKFEGVFASATGTVKTEFDKIVAAVKSADYSGALASIQSLASNVNLSAEQKSALTQLMEQIKSKSGELWKGASEAAGKAVNQATEAAGKAAEKATDAAGKAAGKASDAASKAAKDLLPK